MLLSSRQASTGIRAAGAGQHRVMVVDDSAVIRGLITRILESEPDIQVVSSVGDGKMAVAAITRQPVDVVVLDIEMPVMTGLEALPLLLKACPTAKIVMASTLTKKNAEISVRALELGATDYVPKPSAVRDIHAGDLFKRELVEKVRALAKAARAGSSGASRPAVPGRAVTYQADRRPQVPASAAGSMRAARAAVPPAKASTLAANFRPKIIAIGSSTGGPQALFEVLSHLATGISVPIVVTQHMPPTFTTILAEHITRQCGVRAAEGQAGEALVGGRLYLAPGDFHMTIQGNAAAATVQLDQSAPVNFCRPAVDPMLESVVKVFGSSVVAVILTGMGHDGMAACRLVAGAGGMVVAQDEASSVVWGMPGAVAGDGTANAILPLREIGPYIRKVASKAAA
ncbi:MAG: chemotaxis response regulator protein-glutamate methylesterase [Rhodospirillaceae bacterium]|nr:chemotaxis response regulator protein-glutamate methylesterase [Rhodospirillaceae bacterium]